TRSWVGLGNFSRCQGFWAFVNFLFLLVLINPCRNKLFFAFSYLAYLIWLGKDFAPRRELVALSWPLSGLWLLNPFPWGGIAFFGYFDVLVGLACVAAVYNVVWRGGGVFGTFLAVGIFLKKIAAHALPV